MPSCHAYYGTSVSLNEAYDKGRVKVKSTQGKRYWFTNIELRDSIYYGVNKQSDIRLETALIEGIYLQDNKKSKTQSIIAGVVVIGGFLALFVYIISNMTISVGL